LVGAAWRHDKCLSALLARLDDLFAGAEAFTAAKLAALIAGLEGLSAL
jgi:hypothetical protein